MTGEKIKARPDILTEIGDTLIVADYKSCESGMYFVTACDEGSPAGEGIWYKKVVVIAECYVSPNGSITFTWYEGTREYDITDIVTAWIQIDYPEPFDMDV